MVACVLAVVPLLGHANPTAENKEMGFLDLVDGEGNVLIQAQGFDSVNAEARSAGPRPGLSGPGLLLLVARGALLCETCYGRLRQCVQAL